MATRTPKFPVGIWVWMGKWVPHETDVRHQYIEKMFGKIADLGCNLVVIGADASEERRELMDRAHASNLRVIISCGNVHTWVRTGCVNDQAVKVVDVVDREVEQFADHPALAMYFINDIPGPTHIKRLASATARFQELDPHHPTYVPYNYMTTPFWQVARTPALSWDNFPVMQHTPPGILVNDSYNVGSTQAEALREIATHTPEARHITLVQCWGYQPGEARQRIPLLSDLRQQTFLAMANGWTDGVIFYHYHSRYDSRPGGPMRYAIFNPDETLRVGPEKELKSFINKIHTIGNALVGAQVQEVRGIRPRWPVQAACFKRGQRRLLMLMSHDMTNTQNQKIDFHQLNTDCVTKVIDCVSGDSFVPQSSGEIELPLHLEPGDASLFEVFAQTASDPD